jgi:signal transduction histidine kinase
MAQLRGEALRQERTINQRKDQLLSTVSHELNTPLVAILGWTRLLRSSPPSQSTLIKSLDTIERNATLQARLIQDLLDISRITAGKLHLHQEPVELKSIVEMAIATVSQTAAAKKISLARWVVTPQASNALQRVDSVVVMGDRDRLQQVFTNLLTNAIKFTPEGGRIAVSLSLQESREAEEQIPITNYNSLTTTDYSYAQVTIADTGIGISAESLPHIFDYLYQEENLSSSQGLGLGLAIAHHLVELHQGTIKAESLGVGQGATFTVRLTILKKSSILS